MLLGRDGSHLTALSKGLVESLVGYARRNFLVPLPRVSSLDELNADLRRKCLAEQERSVGRRDETVGELWEEEGHAALAPLPN